MTTRASICAFSLLFLTFSPTADAQEQDSEIAIVATAADHFASLFGNARIVVDPRIAARAQRTRDGTFDGEWPSRILETLTARLDARSARQADVILCAPEQPASCTISGAAIFMKFDRPRVVENTATLYVTVMSRTGSARTPVGTRQHEVVLKLDRGSWRVVSATVVAQN